MEFKGTKEKLSVSDSNSQNINAEGKGLVATTFHGKGIFNNDVSKEESYANAVLFSFAPEMLDTLRQLCEDWNNGNFESETFVMVDQLIKKATTI